MPNWTSNLLRFNSIEDAKKVWEGMQKEIKKPIYDSEGNIIGENTIKRFSYQTIIPYPNSPEETKDSFLKNEKSFCVEDYERPWLNWYEWNYYYWGVKWDACDPYYNGEFDIYFDSPWSKPDKAIFEGIAKKFNVEFCTAHNNEDGGWEEVDYYWSPEGSWEETSQWQVNENN